MLIVFFYDLFEIQPIIILVNLEFNYVISSSFSVLNMLFADLKKWCLKLTFFIHFERISCFIFIRLVLTNLFTTPLEISTDERRALAYQSCTDYCKSYLGSNFTVFNVGNYENLRSIKFINRISKSSFLLQS